MTRLAPNVNTTPQNIAPPGECSPDMAALRIQLRRAHPFFYVALARHLKWVERCDGDGPDPCPTLYVTMDEVHVNVGFMRSLGKGQQLFAVAHEVLHRLLNHPRWMGLWARRGWVTTVGGKRIPYDGEVMNVAMDFHINDVLVGSCVGNLVPGCAWRGLDDRKRTVVDIYVDLMDVVDTANDAGMPCRTYADIAKAGAARAGADEFDRHVAARVEGDDRQVAEAAEADTRQSIRTLAQHAGRAPGSLMEQIAGSDSRRISFEAALLRLLQARASEGEGARKGRPYVRRLLNSPASIRRRRTEDTVGPLVVAVDTSGSIPTDVLQRTFAQLAYVVEEVVPESLTVLWIDAAVRAVDTFSAEDGDAIAALERRRRDLPGRGGTRFKPAFDKVAELEIAPDQFVYITDGFGPMDFPAPAYPVLWALTKPIVTPPWGTVVLV